MHNLLCITVIAGNEGVPDALQKCHSLSRDLQNNQTIIFSRLSDLKQQINNFTVQVKSYENNINSIVISEMTHILLDRYFYSWHIFSRICTKYRSTFKPRPRWPIYQTA